MAEPRSTGRDFSDRVNGQDGKLNTKSIDTSIRARQLLRFLSSEYDNAKVAKELIHEDPAKRRFESLRRLANVGDEAEGEESWPSFFEEHSQNRFRSYMYSNVLRWLGEDGKALQAKDASKGKGTSITKANTQVQAAPEVVAEPEADNTADASLTGPLLSTPVPEMTPSPPTDPPAEEAAEGDGVTSKGT